MTNEERERLERFRRGEPGAFDALYAEYGPRLYRFGLRLCGGVIADAEDLTQEVFVAAFRSLHQFEGRSSLSTYLFRIAVYRWRHMRGENGCRSGGGSSVVPLDGREPSGGAASDPAYIGAARMALSDALAALPAAQREAFLLVKSEGLTCREAADALGIPVGTVKYHIHEAVMRLRAYLGDEDAMPVPPHRIKKAAGNAL